ncbi:MAG: hypothetical protein CMO80_15025 [Verrucomicrobiales bacterium]|nr:hypothetical protein [Verrucomicrobiales bacterium]
MERLAFEAGKTKTMTVAGHSILEKITPELLGHPAVITFALLDLCLILHAAFRRRWRSILTHNHA